MQYLTSFIFMFVDRFEFHHLVERNILSHSLMNLITTFGYFSYNKRVKFFWLS
jgi:hypothetical protein